MLWEGYCLKREMRGEESVGMIEEGSMIPQDLWQTLP
jgi:hypothetical protein